MSRFEVILEEIAAAKRPFHINELLSRGMTRMALSRLLQEEKIARPLRGVYRVPFEGEDKSGLLDIACISTGFPDAVLCSRTAAYLHRMTEGNLGTYYFGIPWKNRYPPTWLMDNEVRFIKWRNARDLDVGVEKVTLANTSVKITSRERTLVDIFRYSSYKKRGEQLDLGIDPETFHDVLDHYLHDSDKRPDELAFRHIAKAFGVYEELSMIIETNKSALGRSPI